MLETHWVLSNFTAHGVLLPIRYGRWDWWSIHEACICL